MNTILALVAALALASVASAQPIHGHPQKAAYASPAEYVEIDSQGHHTLPGLGPIPITSPLSQHTHIAWKCPLYSETTGALVHCTFTIKAQYLVGFVAGLFGELLRNTVYDSTGDGHPTPMIGDPNALKQWTGSFDIDTSVGGAFHAPLHGKWAARIGVLSYLACGARVKAEGWSPFYSVVDPTTPEVPVRSNGTFILETQVDTVTCAGKADRFGTSVVEFLDVIPLAPIDTPFSFRTAFYSYSGDPAMPNGLMDQRLDPDFHNGKPGIVIDHNDNFSPQPSAFVKTMTIDPTGLTPGTHRALFDWTGIDAVTHEQMSVLSAFLFTVGPSVPPPLLCEDPTATNFQGPLPCVVPVLPVWAPITAFFERFGSEDRYRLCDAFHLSCRELVFK